MAMGRLYDHLAEIVETADGGFNMTRKSRQYFNRFLRQHGKALRDIGTHAALIEALRECNDADFALLRQRRRLAPVQDENRGTCKAGNEAMHRQAA
jgi:hypothetical protein